jgi:hypothetical protein
MKRVIITETDGYIACGLVAGIISIVMAIYSLSVVGTAQLVACYIGLLLLVERTISNFWNARRATKEFKRKSADVEAAQNNKEEDNT